MWYHSAIQVPLAEWGLNLNGSSVHLMQKMIVHQQQQQQQRSKNSIERAKKLERKFRETASPLVFSSFSRKRFYPELRCANLIWSVQDDLKNGSKMLLNDSRSFRIMSIPTLSGNYFCGYFVHQLHQLFTTFANHSHSSSSDGQQILQWPILSNNLW